MSTVKWKLEDDLCRCCHSEGSFKNLAGAHSFGNDEEIYFDMLRDTLDINMAPVPGMLCVRTYTICDTCIFRLRDACNFKKQVMECEEKFKEMYSNNAISVVQSGYRVEVKQEPVEGEPTDSKSDLGMDEDDDDFDPKEEEDSEDNSILSMKKIKQEIAARSKRSPAKPKSKPKAKKPAKKPAATKKTETEKEKEKEKQAQKTEKGGKAPAAPKFRVPVDDYKKEGDVFICCRCNKMYDRMHSLVNHIKAKHYNIPSFQCPYCPVGFTSPGPLTVHKLQMHGVDDRYKCEVCDDIFTTKLQRRRHMGSAHQLGKKYSCGHCEYETFRIESMYKHRDKHKTEKDHHCRFCNKSFVRRKTLDLHERIHTGDRRKVCLICGQAFVQTSSLTYHMSKFHSEIDQQQMEEYANVVSKLQVELQIPGEGSSEPAWSGTFGQTSQSP